MLLPIRTVTIHRQRPRSRRDDLDEPSGPNRPAGPGGGTTLPPRRIRRRPGGGRLLPPASRVPRRLDLVIFLRSGLPQPAGPYEDPDQAAAATRYLTQIDPENIADIVVDLHDPGWPVIRRIDPPLADRLDPQVFLAETRVFFAPEQRPGNSASPTTTPPTRPSWTWAAAPAGPFPTFGPRSARTAASSGSTSPRRCRPPHAAMVATRTRCWSWATPAAGLLPHLSDPDLGLTELARVTVPDGRLVLFHPSGRAALAARHGRRLRPGRPPIRSAGSWTARGGRWPATTTPRPLPRHRRPGSRTHPMRTRETRTSSTLSWVCHRAS